MATATNQMTTFEDYLALCRAVYARRAWTWGETLFMVLDTHGRSDLSGKVHGTVNDPFYARDNGVRVHNFLRFVEDNW